MIKADNYKIACVLVTFNKKQLLYENVKALLSQTFGVDFIIIIDNNSTDGSYEYLMKHLKAKEIKYFYQDKNVGGAGGFNIGIKKAYELGADYIWIMDDDTIPYENALENLIKPIKELDDKWGFLTSDVRWIDNQPCVMNIPETNPTWTEMLDLGLVKSDTATFVSLLIPRRIVKEIGFPIKEFFIWGDDTEYTTRITKKYSGYLVIGSKVVHKMKSNSGIDIVNDNKQRISRYYYRYRNKVYIAKKNGAKSFVRFTLHSLYSIFRVIVMRNDYKAKKISIIVKGYVAGLFFDPVIELPDK